MLDIRITETAYHRNGSGGEPFWVLKFNAKDSGFPRQSFVGIVPAWGEGQEPDTSRCYVLDADLAAQGCVTFGVNSFNGGRYVDALLCAIKGYRFPHEVDREAQG